MESAAGWTRTIYALSLKSNHKKWEEKKNSIVIFGELVLGKKTPKN